MPDAETRQLTMIVCDLNAHHYYALTICNERELGELIARIGTRCFLCGAPLSVIDLAAVVGEQQPLKIERPRGDGR